MLYGIGVGPGDSELLTLKAKKILEKVPVVFTQKGHFGPNYVLETVKPYLPEDTEVIPVHFMMVNFHGEFAGIKKDFDEDSKKIFDALEKGDAALLVPGDPNLFSSYNYIIEYLKEVGGVETETIPGISAFQSLASDQKIDLTKLEQSVVILSTTMDFEKIREEIENHKNIVILDCFNNLKKLKELLIDMGLENNFIMMVNSGREDEFVITDIEDLSRNIKGPKTMIIKKEGRQKIFYTYSDLKEPKHLKELERNRS